MNFQIFLKTGALFGVTALAEICGCYLPYLYLKKNMSAWLMVSSIASLLLFAWLLTLHPVGTAGRTYAAYGGVYVTVAIVWMALVEHQRPDLADLMGALLIVGGSAVIVLSPHRG